MPVWDFKCENCGKVFDAFLHHHSDYLACPDCGHSARMMMPRVMIKMGSVERMDALIDIAEMNAKMEREEPHSVEVKKLKHDPAAVEAKQYCDSIGRTI